MARLIFFAKPDNDDPDPFKAAGKFKRGDLVDILPDGADPGREVLSRGWWRVIDVPGADAADFSHLLAGQIARDGIIARKRLNKIDLDSIEAVGEKALGRKLVPSDVLSATRQQVLAIVGPKADIRDPTVL